MSFLEFRNFKFQPDRSSGLESDYIVMPNILVLVRPPVLVPVPPPPQPLGTAAGSSRATLLTP